MLTPYKTVHLIFSWTTLLTNVLNRRKNKPHTYDPLNKNLYQLCKEETQNHSLTMERKCFENDLKRKACRWLRIKCSSQLRSTIMTVKCLEATRNFDFRFLHFSIQILIRFRYQIALFIRKYSNNFILSTHIGAMSNWSRFNERFSDENACTPVY